MVLVQILGGLHDATLELLIFNWREGTLQIALKTGTGQLDKTTLFARGVTELRCPRLLPWGPSSSINTTNLEQLGDASYLLTIEMQSGDSIEVCCGDVSLDSVPAKWVSDSGFGDSC
jgi:hypothetical protein